MPTPTCLPTPKNGWQPITIRPMHVLVRQVEGVYVGQCLEHKVAVQGDNLQALAEALTEVLVTQCVLDQSAGREMLSTLGESPKEFWDAYTRGLPLSGAMHEVRIEACETQESTAVKCDFALAA